MSKKEDPNNVKFPLSEIKGKPEFSIFLIKNKTKVTNALNDFFIGVKNEASDTKEATRIIAKFVVKQKITKEEEKHLKAQVYDIFKILGIGVPFMLIPGATILIPFILKAAEKKGLDLYPSNFKSKEKTTSTDIYKQP